METNSPLDPLIKNEILRKRIRSIMDEPQSSWWHSFSRHPLTAIVVGFFFTVVLAQFIKDQQEKRDKAAANQQEKRDKAAEKRAHEYAMQSAALQQKHAAGILAVQQFSDIMFGRLTRSAMLESSLVRQSPVSELEDRKAKFDEAYVKWNVLRQKTYLSVQEIDLTLFPKIQKFDDSLVANYEKLDYYLMQGYDTRRSGHPWHSNKEVIDRRIHLIRHLSNNMLNTIWTETRVNSSPSDTSLISSYKTGPS